ncbi:DUF1918 domain-containing protein [Geodermatophilus poikilotrophus]|uniref:DUF1918 domain-containing protein n=1 Tax=Geodermatophilus poikilotrophus TaxID=1333667 RepID=A0A1H9YPC4_9ACTN|nr:DUF1918 domain-containing protein [Geodermatophilus poikilotrophus]SES70985.1 protein of unknown function [Geodermatophilus poikilotrophus]
MQARVGDRIVVRSTHQGEAERTGRVLEVRGESGGPPYVVRWDPDGHTGVFHPAAGTCAVVPEPANG